MAARIESKATHAVRIAREQPGLTATEIAHRMGETRQSRGYSTVSSALYKAWQAGKLRREDAEENAARRITRGARYFPVEVPA